MHHAVMTVAAIWVSSDWEAGSRSHRILQHLSPAWSWMPPEGLGGTAGHRYPHLWWPPVRHRPEQQEGEWVKLPGAFWTTHRDSGCQSVSALRSLIIQHLTVTCWPVSRTLPYLRVIVYTPSSTLSSCFYYLAIYIVSNFNYCSTTYYHLSTHAKCMWFLRTMPWALLLTPLSTLVDTGIK